MRVLMAFLIFSVLSLCTGEVFAEYKKSGPIGVRNQMPLYLFFLQMVPDKAEVVEPKKLMVGIDYSVSNITVSSFTPVTSRYYIDIDMEISRITLDFRYSFYDNFEIGLEVPYLFFSGGYLDGTIEGFESAINATTPRSRKRQGKNNYEYSFRYNWRYIIRKTVPEEGLGDIIFNTKYQILKEDDRFMPNFSIRSALKFPTGDENDLFGSGEYDYGFGFLVDKKFFERLFIYGGFNIVMIEQPSVFDQLPDEMDGEIFSGMLGTEYFFTKRFSGIMQVTGNSTPYWPTETNVLENTGLEFCVGVNYFLDKEQNLPWNFAIVENIRSASSPDVTFQSSLKYLF